MNPYEPTDTDYDPYEPAGVRVTELRRIQIGSVVKLTGVLYAGIGLLFGGIYGVIGVLVGVGGAVAGEPESLVMAVGGVAMVVAFPVFYGIIGAIAAAIGALIYNLAAARLGGVRVELHDVG